MAPHDGPALGDGRRRLPILRVEPGPGAAPALPPRSVRVSLTDRCDFACTYCRPSRRDGYAPRRLSVEGWRAMFLALRDKGVRRVRLTGGEPLLHGDVVRVVELLASLGFEDVALTTNASRLADLARPLARAGLHRVNVSLDSLRAGTFSRLTRGGDLRRVLRGVDAALEAGLRPLKLNAVILRGENDDELEDLLLWAWDRGAVPRFLELMRVGEGARLPRALFLPAAEMRERLAGYLSEAEPVVEADRGPARYVAARHDPSLRVGFITGESDTYCASCDRLRVSSTGTLRPCLATNDGVEAGGSAEAGEPGALAAAIDAAWALKPDGATWKGCTESSAGGVSMRAIGG